jgi:hypothetical protein
MSYKIILLGSLPKGDEARKSFVDWKRAYQEKLSIAMPGALFLDGDAISDNVGPELVVGHDLSLLTHADRAIVDASTKIGAGTAQEMMMAKYFAKPLVAIMPKNTHHRKTDVIFDGILIKDWIHPFLYVCSDFIAETIEEAIPWIQSTKEGRTQVKDFNIFEEAIEQFERITPGTIVRP